MRNKKCHRKWKNYAIHDLLFFCFVLFIVSGTVKTPYPTKLSYSIVILYLCCVNDTLYIILKNHYKSSTCFSLSFFQFLDFVSLKIEKSKNKSGKNFCFHSILDSPSFYWAVMYPRYIKINYFFSFFQKILYEMDIIPGTPSFNVKGVEQGYTIYIKLS